MSDGILHTLILEQRTKLTISGVSEICGFDENYINMVTEQGILSVKGKDIKVVSFDTDSKNISVSGNFFALIYVNDDNEKKGFFKSLFR